MAEKDDKLKQAQKVAREKIHFIRHLIIYAAVIVFLVIINNVTYSGYQWWKWPAIGWGIGIVFHFLGAWGFKGSRLKNLEQKLTQKEFEKMKEEE